MRKEAEGAKTLGEAGGGRTLGGARGGKTRGQGGPLRFFLLACVVACGCALVTNLGTGGYEPIPSSACNGASGDSACSTSTSKFCASTADCPDAEICCLTATIAPSFSIGCQMGPSCSGLMGAQLCGDAGDCQGGACIEQTCSVLFGAPTLVQTCGPGVGLGPFCGDAGP